MLVVNTLTPPEGSASSIVFSIGRDRTDNHPEQIEVADFAAFKDRVFLSRHEATKDHAPYFARAFAPNEDGTPTRGADYASPAKWIALDIDELTPEAAEKLTSLLAKKHGFWYSTASATTENLKRRIVLELARETSSAEHPIVAEALEGWLLEHVGAGVKFDHGADADAARIWFLPMTTAAGGEFDGTVIDVDRLLTTADDADQHVESDAVLQNAKPVQRIVEGNRNMTLTRFAGRLRRIGLSTTELEAALLGINHNRCSPQLPDHEVRQIAASIGRYAAGDAEDVVPELRVLTLPELLSHEFPQREAILTPWLLTQSLNMIHAWRGVGKTHFGVGSGYAVATGGQFLTWKAPRPRRVLYIDGEMPGAALRDRLKALVEADDRDIEFDPANLLIVTPDAQQGSMPDLANIDGQEAIERVIMAHQVELIIVDNISTLFRNAGPENDAESWRGPQEWALRMRRAGRAVLFIHHDGKGGLQRGSSKKEDILDVVIQLKHPTNYSADEGARFEVYFKKFRNDAGEGARPIEARLGKDANGRTCWTSRSVEQGTFDRVVALANEGLKTKEIADELGIDITRASHHLSRARREGKVVEPKS